MPLELVKKNQTTLLNQLISIYESLSGVTLEQASSERILTTTISELGGVLTDQINEAGRQNFLSYASGDLLDAIGDTRGVPRQESQPSKTVIRFTFSAALTAQRVIPQNLLVTNGTYDFKVLENVLCSATETYKDVTVECTESGTASNTIAAGDIDSFGTDSNGNLFSLDFVSTIANTIPTYNGAAEETDAYYRDRLYLAMARYTQQDPQERYIFDIKTEYPDIIDVNTTSTPGILNVTILAKNVTAWTTAQLSALLSDVDTYLQTEKKKLLDYTINTALAEAYTFTASVTITPYLRIGINSDDIKAQVAAAIDSWASSLTVQMGIDVVRSQLFQILQNIEGIKEVEITSPLISISIPKNKYAELSAYSITMNTPEVA